MPRKVKMGDCVLMSTTFFIMHNIDIGFEEEETGWLVSGVICGTNKKFWTAKAIQTSERIILRDRAGAVTKFPSTPMLVVGSVDFKKAWVNGMSCELKLVWLEHFQVFLVYSII